MSIPNKFVVVIVTLVTLASWAVVYLILGRGRATFHPATVHSGTASGRSPEIVLSFAGDCTFGSVNGDGDGDRFPSVFRRSGEPGYPFARVKSWLAKDDLTAVNFECTLTERSRPADKQWRFKGPASYTSIFPAASVEAVGLANNHSHDYLQAGFDDTVANFRLANIPAFYQNKPYITTLKGIETVLIGDCTVVGENTTALDGVAERVGAEMKRHKRPGNIVIVVMHWGSELDTVPRPWQQAMGRAFIDDGADAVVGHHPHVIQGIERYKGKYIAYSLGNFAFGGNSRAKHPETFILRLMCREQTGVAGVAGLSIVPCFTTSTHKANGHGVLIYNYQPTPTSGSDSNHIVHLLLERCGALADGLKTIETANGP